MTSAVELARAVEEALAFVTGQPGILEAEIFAAANDALLTRLNYTPHIPSNGVEEPKSTASYGLGIRAVFGAPSGPRIGFSSEPSDLSVAGARRALDRARTSAVADPEFVSLPHPSLEPRALVDYHDPALMALDDARLVEAGWKIVGGALRTFTASGKLAALAGDDAGLRRLGLILGGDVTARLERVAIASTHMPRVQTDESTLITAFATAMVESRGAKGSGAFAGTRLDHFTDEAGVEAAHHAIAAIGGERVPSGEYTVVFGRQPVADLLNNIVVPACTARAFYAEPGIAASNVIVEGAAPVSLEELLRTVRDGLYIGRIWYTYPINGLRAGDFTCTVVADSYIIRDGRLAAPLKANAIRINENIGKILNSIVGITKDVRGTIVWAADEVVYAPEIAVRGVRVDEIAAFMEELD